MGSTAPADGAIFQGFVGIGTASPGWALDVNETIRANSSYPFIIGTTGLAYIPSESSTLLTTGNPDTSSIGAAVTMAIPAARMKRN